MKIFFAISMAFLLTACDQDRAATPENPPQQSEVSQPTPVPDQATQAEVDRFADIQILAYEVPGFDELSLQEKKLVYYLSQAALAGRDINLAE